MSDEEQLETALRELIMDICEVMYRRGYEAIPVGAVMRLVGVGDERAKMHDKEYLSIDRDLQFVLENRKDSETLEVPPGTTLH